MNPPPENHLVLRWMRAASTRFRRARLARFLSKFDVNEHTRILDVGGSRDWDWGGWSGQPPRLTILNRDVEERTEGTVQYVRGDACDMACFSDHEFDIVFSNSVIEHVGDYDRQRNMAREIRRVGKGYWVQTPYRHFPVEPHMLFPFFQYFPLRIKRTIARHWPFSFQMLRGGDPERDAIEVRLLNRRELQECFPDADIGTERFAGFIKSLIAFKRSDCS